MAESIVPSEDFMLGGGQRYELSDPFESALSVSLREDTTVYARTGDKGVPLVWEHSSGSGRVVVDNIGIYDKVLRGVYAASYSLLCDATAYPSSTGRCSTWTISPPRCRAAMAPISAGITA